MKYKLGIVTAIANEQKGQTFPFCKKDSHYEGEITEIKDGIAVVFRKDSGTWLFNLDGSCLSHTGMSLLPNNFSEGEGVTMVVHEDIKGVRKIKAGSYDGIVEGVYNDIVTINVLDGKWDFGVSTLENIVWKDKVTLQHDRKTYSNCLKSSEINIMEGRYMEFEVDMPVVMTVDRSKGAVFDYFVDGEHVGQVIKLPTEGIFTGQVQVRIPGRKEFPYFNKDGTKENYPGMSLRPAKSRVVTASFSRCEQCGAKDFIGKHVCTQWIVGQIPNTVIGKLFHVLCEDGEIRQVYRPNEYSQNHVMADGEWKEYTHYCPASIQSPPTPPVAEVEAFGILERIKQIRADALGGKITHKEALTKIDEAIAFYSQPATAEVLNKYFTRKEKEYNLPSSRAGNIDEYIAQSKGYGLIFKPAALKELGVK